MKGWVKYFDVDRFREIYETLIRNKSRSILTGFGVFWGIFMLLFMMGGGQGVKDLIQVELQGFATNSGFIVPMETSLPYQGFRSGRTWTVTMDDIERLKRGIPEIATVTGNLSVWGGNATYEEKTSSCQGRGVSPDYADIEQPLLKYGRYINSVDLLQERKVCVIGKRVYRDLFEDGEDPCGKFIQMQGMYFQVVGVDFSSGNISINGSVDESVTIPMSVLQRLYNRGKEVDLICIVAKPGCKIKDILTKAKPILAKEHFFSPDDPKAMYSVNLEELFSIMDNLFKGVSLLIWIVGFGTLLAASIGVSNIMMVTVKERTTEIGIRRAIGATPSMILSQIMLESVILTIVSGMMGILLSVGALSIAENVASASAGVPIGFQLKFSTAMLALIILMILGLLAGLAPALRAMDIKPVDAMREE
ncbi:MAG: ABC transporter permease [Bacteroidales bacterium]|nr:ABC transporter permease [Bacteroidales bacterium]